MDKEGENKINENIKGNKKIQYYFQSIDLNFQKKRKIR